MSEEDDQELELYWDATFAIAISLMTHYPDLQPEYVGQNELVELIISLPGFQDDPALVTERILQDIQITWFEEATS